jgi:hypothetical protein
VIKSREELLELLIRESLRQRSKSPVAYSWNGSNQCFSTITLEGTKSKIRPQAAADNLNRTPCTSFAVMNDKLLNILCS